MSRNRFTIPDVRRIYLKDSNQEEWFEIKKELNAGEERRQSALGMLPVDVGGRIMDRVDWGVYELLRCQLWMTNWHLHDEKGEVPPLTLDALRALDPETFHEINNSIYEHIEELAAAKKKAKTPPTPQPEGDQTSS